MRRGCFEKSIVPGSLGEDEIGLSGSKQDKLLLDENGWPKTVQGMRYASPTDYQPINSVLDNFIKLHLINGGEVENLTFCVAIRFGMARTSTATASPAMLTRLWGFSRQGLKI